MQKLLSRAAAVVAAGCVLGAGWVGWQTYGSDVSQSAAQGQLMDEFNQSVVFVPVELDISNPTVWYGSEQELQEYVEPGSDVAETTGGVVDPAPNVSKSEQDKANSVVRNNTKANSIPGWAPPVGRVTEGGSLPKEGEVWGRIRIPAINVDQVIVAGTSLEALNVGPGVWRYGALPGELGNATISGHRTSHGGPFLRLDDLTYGDKIFVDTLDNGTSVYEVRGHAVVKPNNVAVTKDSGGVRLTLTTCHPEHSTKFRLIVQAEMIEGDWIDKAHTRAEWEMFT